MTTRFDQRYTVSPGGCWVWTSTKKTTGYGVLRVGGRQVPAHRVSYEMHVGPIPDGLVIDHLCRNRACVNPAHLEPVTNGANVLRGEGPAAANARKTKCDQGHEFTPENTSFSRGGRKRRCRTCMRAWARASYNRRILAAANIKEAAA